MANKRGNNEGTIYKDEKNGRWIAQATIDGKRKSFYGKTRTEANKKLTDAIKQNEQGTYIDPSKLTLGEWLDKWLMTYKMPSLKPKTIEGYYHMMELHVKPELGKIKLKDLTADRIQNHYRDKTKAGYSSKTVKHIHTIIHDALKHAVRMGELFRNVSDHAILPKQETIKPMRVLTKEEQQKFMDTCKAQPHDGGLAFILDLATGLRLGELLAVTWDDIDIEAGVLKVSRNISRIMNMDTKKTEIMEGTPKTKAGKRSIPIPTSVFEMLKAYKPEDERKGLLFPSSAGTPIEPRNMQRKFYNMIEKAEIEKANIHALRHTYCTRLLESGVQPNTAKELMGHSSIQVTLDIYGHVMPEMKHSAVDTINHLF